MADDFTCRFLRPVLFPFKEFPLTPSVTSCFDFFCGKMFKLCFISIQTLFSCDYFPIFTLYLFHYINISYILWFSNFLNLKLNFWCLVWNICHILLTCPSVVYFMTKSWCWDAVSLMCSHTSFYIYFAWLNFTTPIWYMFKYNKVLMQSYFAVGAL